jgi:cyclomaltodextrinase / maltogenic alpha-amylase / neopullulanase
VLPDTSLNHTGSDSVYFDRYANFKSQGAFAGGRINTASPYATWYSFDTTQTEPDKQFKGWVGVSDLPELNKASPAFRKFAYGAPNSVMKRWLDRGAAGWRMDVAPWVPDDFWREWRSAIKTHKPDAITVSETWFDASKYFLGDMFDSTMNYIFRNTVLEYAAGGDASALYLNLEHLREAYPQPALFAAMNLISSHDQARALHHFGWHNGPGDSADATTIGLAKKRLILAVMFQMIYPGAPAIYYGDEVGVTGGDDPYNRATYPWADLGGKPDNALLAEFKKLTRLRQQHAVLRRGSLDAPLFIDSNVVVLLRRLDTHTQRGAHDRWALTATNNATTPRELRLRLPAGAPSGPWRNALGGAGARVQNSELRITVPALYGTVLMSR